MLFRSERLLMLVETVRHETSNIIEETVSTYNIFKERIFEVVNKTPHALWVQKNTSTEGHLFVARGFFVNGI